MTEASSDVAGDVVREAVIFDVDGTLADVSGIRHYVSDTGRGRNFDKFHAASRFVPPHDEIVALANEIHAAGERTVFIVTSRKSRWRTLTLAWLQKWEVSFDYLLMRHDTDDRPDVEVKRDLLRRIRQHYVVTLAVDDNPNVIALWQEQGIPTIVLPGW